MDTQVKEVEQKIEPILKKKVVRNNYSAHEDQLIMDEVLKYPDNLRHGFAEAAKKLKNRKVSNVSSRYYYLVGKKGKDSGVLTGSAVGFSNKKNNQTKGGILTRQEPLKPLSVIIKQLLEFHPEERRKVQEFLKLIE